MLNIINVRVLGLFFCLQCPTALGIEVGILHFPPLYIFNDDKPPTGVLVELLEKILTQAKIDYHFSAYPAKRLFYNLGQGKTDVFLGIKGSQFLEGSVLLGSQVVSTAELQVYTFYPGPIPEKSEQILGQPMGLIRGYNYGGWSKQLTAPSNVHLITRLNSHKNAIAMLQTKRIRYLLDYKQPIDQELIVRPRPLIRHTTISTLDIIFIVSKKNPEAASLLQRLEQAYLELEPKQL